MDKVFISKKEFMMMDCFLCARHNFPLNTKDMGGKCIQIHLKNPVYVL